jgi:RNA polymerase sigma factor (sigma-70 family)
MAWQRERIEPATASTRAVAAAGMAGMAGAPGTLKGPEVMDREEFPRLVEQHTPALPRVTAALVGFADAEDAAQEAVLRAWQARESLRDAEAPRPWLMQIAVNVCRQWQRGHFGTVRRTQLPLGSEETERLAALGTEPGALGHARSLYLRQAINDLETDLRMVVLLRYYKERPKGTSNVFVTDGAQRTVTLSSPDDLSSSPTFNIVRFG